MLRGSVNNTTNVIPTDSNFKQVSLLLHGDGTNGAQNNTFLDSSTNNFTVTRNGNTTQGTNTPFSQNAGYWSNYNPANSTYLTATGSAIDFGTGDFTVEAWIYPTTMQTFNFPIASTGSNNYFGFASTGYLTCYATSAGSDKYQTSGTAVTVNQWNHIAFTRSSGTLYFFVNGSLVGTFASWTYSISSTTAATIGASTTYASYGFIGYMSNVRLVKGTAVYTSAFTPSTTPLTAITNTSLLTCQSSYFKDNSSNNFTLTATGTPSVQPFSPYAPTSAYSTSVNGGSMQFNTDVTDYLYIASGFGVGTNSFTVECWFYFQSSVVFTGGVGIFSSAPAAAFTAAPSLYIGVTSPTTLYISRGGTNGSQTISQTINKTCWNHIAYVKNGSTATIYVNGISVYSATDSINYTDANMLINGFYSSAGTFQTIISNFRVVNGTAVYTANFTPPTAPLTSITNTSLLLSGNNAGIYDNAIKNNLETVGNAQVSTSVVKYGTGSMKFNGTTDYLSIPFTPQYTFGTGNWTVECWIYINSLSASQEVMQVNQAGSTSYANVRVTIATNGSLQLFCSTTGGSWINSSSTPSSTVTTGAWYHLAAVRNGSAFNLYINGTSQLNYSSAVTLQDAGGATWIGAIQYPSTGSVYAPFNGYIDDLRVTKGVARYTANFTAPTAAFPNQ